MLEINYKKIKDLFLDPSIFHYEPETHVAPNDETKYLMYTSLLFLMPSIYGFMHNQLFYAILAFITSIISTNFWRKATYSYRRTCDLIMARISSLIFLSCGTYYTIQNGYNPLMFTWFITVFLLFFCYYKSRTCYNNTQKWHNYHIIFHLLVIGGMLITIKAVIDCKKIENINI